MFIDKYITEKALHNAYDSAMDELFFVQPDVSELIEKINAFPQKDVIVHLLNCAGDINSRIMECMGEPFDSATAKERIEYFEQLTNMAQIFIATTENAIEEIKSMSVKSDVKKCLVDVCFPSIHRTYTYYNDKFSIKAGDIVHVDGKLKGTRGKVVSVNYNFKIKLEDYKKITAVVDLDIKGRFYNGCSHLISFDNEDFMTYKILTMLTGPCDDSDYAVGVDDSRIDIEDLVLELRDVEIYSRGEEYYDENRVIFLSVYKGQGHAAVEGSKTYRVDFKYSDGQISQLVCDCPCGYTCKHEVAVILQLRDTLSCIEEYYDDLYQDSFYAIEKDLFFEFVENGKGFKTIEVK